MPARTTAKASAEGLEKIKRAIAQKGWRKTSPAFVDAACVSTATIKRFWRGIPISQESFEGICHAVKLTAEEIVEPDNNISAHQKTQASLHQGSVHQASACNDIWAGRTTTAQTLSAQLQGSTRILTLVGMTGIGKTALARAIASQLDHYTCIHLQCNQQNSPTLASLSHTLSRQENRTGVTLGLSNLIQQVLTNKYLFVIDGLEHLLESDRTTGHSRFSNRLWHTFFKAVLSVDSCSSRFILTSQTLPNELEEIGNQDLGRWHLQVLAGLDSEAQQSLFEQLDITAKLHSVEADYLAQISRAYAGHPLALRAIAQDIATLFNGNITAYHSEYQQQATAAPLHTQYLRRRLQPKLTRTLQQLNTQLPIAYTLLRKGCLTYPDAYLDGRPSHHWTQLAQTLTIPTPTDQIPADQMPTEQMPTEQIPTEQMPTAKHDSKGQAAIWIDALCDRNLLIPTIANNRLHYRAHPLIYSLLTSTSQSISAS